jgi:hypothetical protein
MTPLQERRCVSIAVLLYTLLSTFLWHNFSNHLGDDGTDIDVSSLQPSIPSTFSDLVQLEMVCDTPNQKFQEKLQQQWDFLDSTIQHNYSQARVSGGIFLYPRQTAIMSYLTCRIQQEMGKLHASEEMKICETGFGSGHSMALFQTAAGTCPQVKGDKPRIKIVSFDKFDRPYQVTLWNHLNNQTTEKGYMHEYIAGNSCKTVPQRLSLQGFHCHILHGSSLCPTDNIDLVEQSPCGVVLTSTAMDDLTDQAVYFGPKAQWRKLRERDCITDPVCFQEDALEALHHDYVFARKGSNITGKFCIAVTTGKCYKPKQQGKVNVDTDGKFCSHVVQDVISTIGLQHLCAPYQIPAPPWVGYINALLVLAAITPFIPSYLLLIGVIFNPTEYSGVIEHDFTIKDAVLVDEDDEDDHELPVQKQRRGQPLELTKIKSILGKAVKCIPWAMWKDYEQLLGNWKQSGMHMEMDEIILDQPFQAFTNSGVMQYLHQFVAKYPEVFTLSNGKLPKSVFMGSFFAHDGANWSDNVVSLVFVLPKRLWYW